MKISLNKRILDKNDECAQLNKQFFADHGIRCINVISSPGSGKTTTLVITSYSIHYTKLYDENAWNGDLLDTIEAALRHCQSMKWNGNHPTVRFIDKVYEKGIRLNDARNNFV